MTRGDDRSLRVDRRSAQTIGDGGKLGIRVEISTLRENEKERETEH